MMAQPTNKPVDLMILVKYAKQQVAENEAQKKAKKAAPPPADGTEANRLAQRIEEVLRWRPQRYVALVATTHCTSCDKSYHNFVGLFIEEYNAEAKCTRKRRVAQTRVDNLPRERDHFGEVEEVNECPFCIEIGRTGARQLELQLPVPHIEFSGAAVLDKVLKALGVLPDATSKR